MVKMRILEVICLSCPSWSIFIISARYSVFFFFKLILAFAQPFPFHIPPTEIVAWALVKPNKSSFLLISPIPSLLSILHMTVMQIFPYVNTVHFSSKTYKKSASLFIQL